VRRSTSATRRRGAAGCAARCSACRCATSKVRWSFGAQPSTRRGTHRACFAPAAPPSGGRCGVPGRGQPAPPPAGEPSSSLETATAGRRVVAEIDRVVPGELGRSARPAPAVPTTPLLARGAAPADLVRRPAHDPPPGLEVERRARCGPVLGRAVLPCGYRGPADRRSGQRRAWTDLAGRASGNRSGSMRCAETSAQIGPSPSINCSQAA
jgi:hypothetical protein